ncbi:glycosyltransferase family 39 protein [Hyphomicrobium methylovorum]|uniref:glycosyltransferase family 39 protein n=1 Tax=Hyphomicrobium methylovorum TaxID=84 RepID=UPI0031B5DBF4
MERRRSLFEGWAVLASRPALASLALLLLCLAIYLPGVVRLPAVDRTEAVYAETTRDMVERGAWSDPRYGSVVHQYRPIGTFWAQGASRWLAGDAEAREIVVYRLPSLIFVTLAVLALFWLGRGLVGNEAALIASALFAVAPLTVLVSTLAIAEGLSLLPATVAMLALARLYAKDDDWRIALLFWAALGLGVLINALLVPIIVIVTILALYAMDRDLSWLKRLRPLVGLPIALAIASPWLLVRAHQDGTPFAGMGWREFLGALGGAQDMKLRAFPGTFLLAAMLGFLPGTALIGTALKRFWADRDQKLARFLLAWPIGYLIYLEALSSKPGTYMVQTMFPAFALAVALVVVNENGDGKRPEWSVFSIWPTALCVLPLAVFFGVYGFSGEVPAPGVAAAIALVASLFIFSGQQGREGALRRWAVTGVIALALFAVTLLGAVLPSIEKIWPSREIAHAIASCPADELVVAGFREPSARFGLGVDVERQTPEAIAKALAGPRTAVTVVEDRWDHEVRAAAQIEAHKTLPEPVGCVSAYNVMRGCPLYFRIYRTGAGASCVVPKQLACQTAPVPAGPEKVGDCD